MKKLGKYIVSICVAVLLAVCAFLPTTSVYADEAETDISPTLNTIYPDGIDHYLNLNDLTDFCVAGDDVFFVSFAQSVDLKKYYSFSKYNISTGASQTLIDSNSTDIMNFVNMQYAQDLVLIEYGFGCYLAYDNQNNRVIKDINTSNLGYFDSSVSFGEFGDKVLVCGIKDDKLVVRLSDSASDFLSGTFETAQLDISSLTIYNNKKIYSSQGDIYLITNNNTDYAIYKFEVSTDTQLEVSQQTQIGSLATLSVCVDLTTFSYNNNSYVAISSNTGISIYNKNLNSNSIQYLDFGKTYSNNLIYIDGSNLYLYNSIDSNIKRYTTSTSNNDPNFTEDKILLMGKGSQVGRFDGVNSIAMKCKEYVFVSDANNNRIQVIKDDGTINVISIGSGHYAKCLMLSSDNTLYFIATDGLLSHHLKKINIFRGDTQIQEVMNFESSVIDATIDDSTDTIYLLNSDALVSYKISTSQTTQVFQTLPFSVNNLSKILYHNARIVVSTDKNLYCFKTEEVSDINTKNFGANICSLSYSDNYVYVCLDNNTIEAVTYIGATTITKTTAKINSEFDLTSICANQQDGSVFAFDKKASRIVWFRESDFCKGYDSRQSFQENALTSIGFDHVVKYGVLKSDSFVYEYVNYKGNHNYYAQNKNVVVLNTNMDTSTFTYILYVDGENIKLGYCKTSDLSEINAVPTNQSITLAPTSNVIPIYKYPTMLGNLKTGAIQNTNDKTITALGAYPVSIDGTRNTFYIVKTDDTYGFVSSVNVTANQNISKKFSPNATIRIYDYSDFVNVYDDEERTQVVGVVSNDQRIYVQELDKNKELTYIKYLDADNNIKEGYIDTKYIKKDGHNPIITTAIVLFVISIVIVMALVTWYVIFKKKQRKDLIEEHNQSLSSKQKQTNKDNLDNKNIDNKD